MDGTASSSGPAPLGRRVRLKPNRSAKEARYDAYHASRLREVEGIIHDSQGANRDPSVCTEPPPLTLPNPRGTQTPEARVVSVTASGQEAHALGLRGNAPLMGSGDARATLRTSGDFVQVDRSEPISTAKPS